MLGKVKDISKEVGVIKNYIIHRILRILNILLKKGGDKNGK